MNKFLALIAILISTLCSCDNEKKRSVLLADREAPLGWVYLNVYDDKTFEFITKDLRNEKVYTGFYRVNKDTIFFNYTDSVPKVGTTAIISKGSVSYLNGNYPESVVIKLNKLTR